ncbi:iron chelate uptake ABC transporter family permease subunit [Corynebacterium belfantii]|uniref:iron chelate uptake ABC transporter family permease subunit n=1 Tax=Corynebacterium belfantii TaxID=2014537 RepID=UPI0018D2D730|nr:iron chelate uptake ABC transporter family permease subunit [Corynebacterium belfantii]
MLSLGNETAIGLGVSINRTRLILLLVCVVLSATATAAVGPIAFVALGAPQLAQRLYRSIIPPLFGSILFGGCLVVWADWIGRALFEQSLPVGVVTAALGAPLLVYLVISSTRMGE